MLFFFKALGSNGDIVKSEIEANSRSEAIASITRQNLRVVTIHEKVSRQKSTFGLNLQDSLRKLFGKKSSNKISKEELLIFFDKLERMLGAGLTITEAITIANKRATSDGEKELTTSLLKFLESGLLFSESLERCELNIGNNILSMIMVGESSGNLAVILPDIVKLLRNNVATKKKIISSLSYPVFMMAFAVIAMVVFSTLILPKLESFITELGATMPPSIGFIKKLSKCVLFSLPVLAATIFATPFILRHVRRTDSGKYATDRVALKIWPLSLLIPLFTKTNLSNILAILLRNGVSTSDALKLAQKSIANKVILERFSHARNAIVDGANICTSLESNGIFEGLPCDFIEIGEKTAKLPDSFAYAHGFYEEALEKQLRIIVRAVGSTAMLLLFSFVGILVISMVQALAGMNTGI